LEEREQNEMCQFVPVFFSPEGHRREHLAIHWLGESASWAEGIGIVDAESVERSVDRRSDVVVDRAEAGHLERRGQRVHESNGATGLGAVKYEPRLDEISDLADGL
jgi:hypothetical protein